VNSHIDEIVASKYAADANFMLHENAEDLASGLRMQNFGNSNKKPIHKTAPLIESPRLISSTLDQLGQRQPRVSASRIDEKN
jgi:hypothetical protein